MAYALEGIILCPLAYTQLKGDNFILTSKVDLLKTTCNYLNFKEYLLICGN